MCGCENWTIKKAEHQINSGFGEDSRDARRLLKGARRSNQSILKEIRPEYSLEGLKLMLKLKLKLKLQYFGHPIQRADSIGKDPDAGKD